MAISTTSPLCKTSASNHRSILNHPTTTVPRTYQARETRTDTIQKLHTQRLANSKTPFTMPNIAFERMHHCPGASKGDCRRTKGLGHCTVHEAICKEHKQYFMKDEECKVCNIYIAAQKEAARREAQQKEAKAAKGVEGLKR